MNSGITMRMNGNTWLSRIQPVAIPRRRVRKRASAYAAGIASRITSTTVARATIRLLRADVRQPHLADRVAEVRPLQPLGQQAGIGGGDLALGLEGGDDEEDQGKARKTMNPTAPGTAAGG